MSALNTILNFDQTIQLRGIAKLNSAQLRVSIENNKDLKRLRGELSSQMNSLNELMSAQNRTQKIIVEQNNKIIEHQIVEIERRETVKFHKNRIFQIKEYLNDYSLVTDDFIKTYLINRFLPELLRMSIESKSVLEDLTDKDYCFKIQKEVETIINGSFNEVSINEIDLIQQLHIKIQNHNREIALLENYEKRKTEELKNLEFNVLVADLKHKSNSHSFLNVGKTVRIIFSFIFGLLCLFCLGFFISDIIAGKNKDFYPGLFFVLFFGALTIIAIYPMVKKDNSERGEFIKRNSVRGIKEKTLLDDELMKRKNTIEDLDEAKEKLETAKNELNNDFSKLSIIHNRLIDEHKQIKLVEYAFPEIQI